MMYNGYITKTKRVLSIVLALLLLFTMIPGSLQEGFAYAAEIVDSGEYENISWTLDSDGLLTITGEGDMPEFTDKIPWSKYWAELLAVSLDERLTSISARAFCGGTYIKSINIPDGVTSIGNDAFENCPGMKEIYISDIVKYLSINYGNRFSHPSVFGTAELYINGEPAENIVIPEGMTAICDTAFYGCKHLKSVTIPDSVTSIGNQAFTNCYTLTSIEIPGDVTYIGESAFSGCTGITNITIPDNVTIITWSTFSGCTGITNITIPANVTSIYMGAFERCSNLTSIAIPDSVTYIKNSAFYDSSNIKNIIYYGDELHWDGINIEDNNEPLSSATRYDLLVTDPEYTGDPVRPEISVMQGETALVQGTDYTVSFDAETTEVDEVGEAVISFVGAYSDLGTLECKYSVLPKSIDIVASGTCGVDGDNLTWTLDEEGVLIISGTGEMYSSVNEKPPLPWYGKDIKCVIIEEGVTTIGIGAFEGCSSLTSITIPEGVIDIGAAAFYNCNSLASITIPKGVTSIENHAFDGCSSLTSITIPEGVTSIGDHAFDGCSSLTSITIPEGVTEIRGYVFSGCSSLTKVLIPESVTSIIGSNDVFDLCTNLSIIYAIKNSYADTWLKDNGFSEIIKYVYKSGEHYYYETIVKEPTCLEEGSKDITCVVCGEERTEITPALNHDLIHHEVKASTEFEEGNIEYWYCSACGKYFADENGTQEISADSIVVPKTDPTYAELSWNIDDDGVLTVSGEGRMPDFDKASDAPWYSERANIKKIIVYEGLTTIGSRAFYQCTNVTEVEIASTVKTIGAWAFYNNTSLTEVTIPAGVISLGDSAFRTCSSLTRMQFEGNVPALGNYVFTDTASDLAIHHYENAEGWDAEAWANYNVVADHKFGGFTVISEPSCTEPGTKQGVCEICGETVIGEIPALGHDYVNGYCLRCGEREIISSGSCGLRARYVLYYGGDMVISGTGTMNYNPFSSIKDSIKTVVIEDGLTEIGYSAFKDCGNLLSISVPDSVTGILSNAFENCSNLASITIPESVTKIGYSGFSGCSSLTSITIPESMSSIEGSVFKGCSSLTSITIPESITSIGNSAFSGCSSLTSVTIPKSVTSIGEWAFDYCTGLEAVYISDLYSWCEISFLSYVSNPLCYANHLYLNGIEVESLIIPDGITSIKSNAFRNCTSLSNITLPDSVQTIDVCAFYGCSSLANINIPEGVTSLGGNAFQNCESLKTITIPGSVANIEDDTFHNCKSLTNVTIFEGVTSIGNSAFNGCTSLTSIMIPDSVTTIRNFVFIDCVKLTNIYVIQDSYADKWFNRTGQDRRVKYVYESGDHYFYDTLTEATCTTPGSRSSLCVVCGEEITENIPALGHDWSEPAFVWNADHSRMTANFVCRNDSSHKDTVIAEGSAITSEITKEPTTAAPGEKVYTASVTFDGKTYTVTDTVVIPKLQHVTRIFGSTRFETSLNVAKELKERLGGEKFKAVVVTNGGFYPDALSGSYLSCTLKAPVLLMDTSRGRISAVQEFIKENLEPGGMVYLLGGTAVVPDSVMTGLNGFAHMRLGGATRYETNISIIEEASKGNGIKELIVCSGNGFADSLSAAATGKPIMILNTTLLDCQKKYLDSLNTKDLKITIVGGPGVIGSALENSLKSYGTTERVWGQTRYETSARVAERFFPKTTSGIIALGTNFPDGLCGGVLANTIGGPMVLVANGTTANAEKYAETSGMSSGIVLGGPALLSDKTAKTVFHMGESDEIPQKK